MNRRGVAIRRPDPVRRRGGPPGPRSPAGSDHAGDTTARVLQAVTALGPPVSVLTGLLFYFGWQRNYVEAGYLGLDEAMLGMSSRDYLLLGVRSLFAPMVAAAVAGLAWLCLHAFLLSRIERSTDPRRYRPAALGMIALGLVLPWAAWAAERAWPAWTGLILPLCLALGVLAVAYGLRLRDRISDTAVARGVGGPPTVSPWARTPARALIGVLVVLALFWEVSNFAGVVGRGYGVQVAAGVHDRIGVVLYSSKRLQISAPGVRETVFADPDSAYRYRYSGLRLLQHSGGRLFLLPEEWTLDGGAVLVIRDNDQIRIELTRGDFGP